MTKPANANEREPLERAGTPETAGDLPDAGPAPGPSEVPYLTEVDRTPNAATEAGEEETLTGLFGEPDDDGFYRGTADDDDEQEGQS